MQKRHPTGCLFCIGPKERTGPADRRLAAVRVVFPKRKSTPFGCSFVLYFVPVRKIDFRDYYVVAADTMTAATQIASKV